ncbi:hypothetical protein GCM10023238_27030 [Streptomyces heliomycini]
MDLRNPLNLVPRPARRGHHRLGVGNVTMEFTDTFSLSGIALGTLVVTPATTRCASSRPAHLKTQEPRLDRARLSYDTDARGRSARQS